MVQILSCKGNYTLLKMNYLIFCRNSDVDLKLFQDKCYCIFRTIVMNVFTPKRYFSHFKSGDYVS
jgi:hypothetical protein